MCLAGSNLLEPPVFLDRIAISEIIIKCIYFYCAPHVFWSLRTPARTPFRTSGVLIMRNFLKRADRVTHRKLPSGPVPEQGRHRYSCNLGSEPEIYVNCNCSCAEVVQNRLKMCDVCLSVTTLIFFKHLCVIKAGMKYWIKNPIGFLNILKETGTPPLRSDI